MIKYPIATAPSSYWYAGKTKTRALFFPYYQFTPYIDWSFISSYSGYMNVPWPTDALYKLFVASVLYKYIKFGIKELNF